METWESRNRWSKILGCEPFTRKCYWVWSRNSCFSDSYSRCYQMAGWHLDTFCFLIWRLGRKILLLSACHPTSAFIPNSCTTRAELSLVMSFILYVAFFYHLLSYKRNFCILVSPFPFSFLFFHIIFVTRDVLVSVSFNSECIQVVADSVFMILWYRFFIKLYIFFSSFSS